MKGWWCCAARKVTLASQRVLAAATRYTHIYETNVTCRLSATETRDRYQPWGAWDHLYFLGLCPRDTALAATPGTGQLQTGAYGIPSAERYGAIVPESTRSGIKPARPSPVTVVVHTTAARPAVPSVNSRPSLVFCCSLHLLEHSAQQHSICTISFFLSPAAKDIPVSSILPWQYPLIFCTAHSWTSQQFRLF